MNNLTTNFHPNELAKFEALADRWWDPHREFWPLHQINPLRLGWIDSLAQLRGKSTLDVGCGGGILSESMAKLGATVTGIDLSTKPLRVAALHAQNAGVDVSYLECGADTLAQTHQSAFDVVTCMEMLEHVPRPQSVIAACAQLVKPGGWVFFSTLNRSPFSWLVAIWGAERILKILPKGTHDYNAFIKPVELQTWATAEGLTLKDQRGLGFNPFSRKFRLHQHLRVGYLLAMQRLA